jgi:hypothetical protein
MEEIQKEGVDPNEIKQDEALAKEPVESEIRRSVIQEFGLDEEVDEDLIIKLTSKELDNHKKLSTAITQKINWRKKATDNKPIESANEAIAKKDTSEDEILKKVDERFEQREIESLDLDDELKTEVKNYAKLNNVSIKSALNSPYIQFRKKEFENKTKADEASIGGTHNVQQKKNYADMNPSDFDLSSEDGRKSYTEWKNWLKTQ